jgi:hypothetical protein
MDSAEVIEQTDPLPADVPEPNEMAVDIIRIILGVESGIARAFLQLIRMTSS